MLGTVPGPLPESWEAGGQLSLRTSGLYPLAKDAARRAMERHPDLAEARAAHVDSLRRQARAVQLQVALAVAKAAWDTD